MHYIFQSSFNTNVSAIIILTESYADSLYGYSDSRHFFSLNRRSTIALCRLPRDSSIILLAKLQGSVLGLFCFLYSLKSRSEWLTPLDVGSGFFRVKSRPRVSARASHPSNDGCISGDLNHFWSVSNSSLLTCVYFIFIK